MGFPRSKVRAISCQNPWAFRTVGLRSVANAFVSGARPFPQMVFRQRQGRGQLGGTAKANVQKPIPLSWRYSRVRQAPLLGIGKRKQYQDRASFLLGYHADTLHIQHFGS